MAKIGRPIKEINWVNVDKLCTIQCTQEEIASFCDVSVDTLERACRREHDMSFAEFYKEKAAKGRISIRRAQFQCAEKGNVSMLIWLGKQYLGQRDKSLEELEAMRKFDKEGIPNKEQLALLLLDAAAEMRKIKNENN